MLAADQCVALGARPATVRDGIEMTNLAFPLYVDGAPPCGVGTDYQSVASFSPSGSAFVVVVRRGNAKAGLNEYELLLWNTKDLGRSRPVVALKMDSSSYYPAIDPSSIVWTRDGRSLTFLGETPRRTQEVYEFNLPSKQLRPLTRHLTPIINYSLSDDGRSLVYEAVGRVESLWDSDTLKNGLSVTNQSVLEVTYGRKEEPFSQVPTELFAQTQDRVTEIPPLPGSSFSAQQGGLYEKGLAVSPDGHYVVVAETVPNSEIPASWWRYTDPLVRLQLSIVGKGEGQETMSRFSRLVLVDLLSGTSRILLNVPLAGGLSRPIVWAPDSRSIVVSDTLLPLTRTEIGERRRLSERTTVEVSVRTGEAREVGSRCVQAVGWDQDELTCAATELSVTKQFEQLLKTQVQKAESGRGACPATRVIRLRKVGDTWRVGREESPATDVFLKEGPNTPPALYYKLGVQPQERELLNLNPQFAHIRLAKEQLVTWEWSKGHSITGGLYYPQDYHPGRRYPLVIQTHGFDAGRFAFWGEFSTSDAAQPLAGRGIFVLQLNDIYNGSFMHAESGQLVEAQRAIEIYRSAISYLSSKGLVDPKRVGIIGFSHTCFYVDWALTQDPGLFAAASVAEGGDASDMEYMLGLLSSLDVNSLYAGPPFGASLRSWVKLSPIFHVDRVQAPLLIVVPHHELAMEEWEWLDGLRMLRKPVEMLVLDGRTHDLHMLQEPWDIAAVAERNVDWFDFWLNGHEDAEPDKVDQYQRWEGLCGAGARSASAVMSSCVASRHGTQGPRRGYRYAGAH